MKRLAAAGLILLVVSILGRNQIAKFFIAHVGSYVLGNNVSVARVAIGWSSIRVESLVVLERRLDDKPQLLVDEIEIEPTVFRGLRSGVWVANLRIERPRVYVRFSRSGNLLSHFPASESKEAQPFTIPRLPLKRLSVQNASLSVVQPGRQTLVVGDVDCRLACDRRLALRVEIGEFLNSAITFLSNVDAVTLAGKSSIEMRPLHLSCRQVSQLPLVPSALRKVNFSTDVYCAVNVEHPPNDLDFRNHALAARVDISQMRGSRRDRLPGRAETIDGLFSSYLTSGFGDHISIRAKNQAGQCIVTVKGPVSSGNVELIAQSDLHQETPDFAASLHVESVDVAQIVHLIAPELPVAAVCDIEGKLHATYELGTIQFATQVTPVLRDLAAANVPFEPVSASFISEGAFHLASSTAQGNTRLTVRSLGVDLARLRESGLLAEMPALADAGGRVSFEAEANIPLASIANLDTYSAATTIGLDKVRAGGLQLNQTRLVARMNGGMVTIECPESAISVQPTEQRAAGCLANLMHIQQDGSIQFAARATSTIANAAGAEGWHGQARMLGQRLAFKSERVEDFQIHMNLADGKATLSPTEIAWRQTRLRVSAAADLVSQPSAVANFSVTPFPLRDIGQAISQHSSRPLAMSGSAESSGVMRMDFTTGAVEAQGELQLANTSVQNQRIGNARLNWYATKEAIQLQSASRDFLGGQLTCGAILRSLDWTTSEVVATCENVLLERIIPAGSLPANLSGRASGQLTIDRISPLEDLDASGVLRVAGGKLGSIPFSIQTDRLEVVDGKVACIASAKLADGDVTITANAALPELLVWQESNSSPENIPVEVDLRTTSISARPFIATFDQSRQLVDLRASGSLSLVRNRNAIDQGILGYATAVVDYVSLRGSVLATRLTAEIVAKTTNIRIRKVAGRVAGGNVRGQADLGLSPLNGRYRISLENASLRRAFASVPSRGRSVSGTGSIVAEGRIGNLCTANAKLKMANVVASGLMIRELRMPLTADYQLGSGRASWRTRAATLQMGGGLVRIDSEGSLAKRAVSFTTGVQISKLDTAKLLHGKSINAGIVDGALTLRAKRGRGPEDVVGDFQINLSQLQGFEVPGFDQLLQLAKMPSFTANQLGENDIGIINGRVGGGLVHIDDATLSKSGILVLMDGTATMAGRINMDVTAITNPSGPADGLLDFANSPLMLAAPAPVALLAKANDALKDRVIYVAVTGTAGRPTLHVQPGKSLSQDALRFVLSTAIGNRAANVAVRRPSQNNRR